MSPATTADPEKPEKKRLGTVGYIAAAVWIFGGSAWFYIHFSGVFYQANRSAIDGAIAAARSLFGL